MVVKKKIIKCLTKIKQCGILKMCNNSIDNITCLEGLPLGCWAFLLFSWFFSFLLQEKKKREEHTQPLRWTWDF